MKTITLANLKDSTAQEVFDYVSHHLLTQNQQSITASKCAYRGDDGLKCAVGCIIADDEYNPIFDDSRESAITRLVKDGKIKVDKHLELLQKLQGVHDTCPTIMWKDQLKSLAKSQELTTDIINNL